MEERLAVYVVEAIRQQPQPVRPAKRKAALLQTVETVQTGLTVYIVKRCDAHKLAILP